jgi:hypothetical protein
MKNIKITLLGIIVLLATVHGAAQTCPSKEFHCGTPLL